MKIKFSYPCATFPNHVSVPHVCLSHYLLHMCVCANAFYSSITASVFRTRTLASLCAAADAFHHSANLSFQGLRSFFVYLKLFALYYLLIYVYLARSKPCFIALPSVEQYK